MLHLGLEDNSLARPALSMRAKFNKLYHRMQVMSPSLPPPPGRSQGKMRMIIIPAACPITRAIPLK
jgi:hypothetical protein